MVYYNVTPWLHLTAVWRAAAAAMAVVAKYSRVVSGISLHAVAVSCVDNAINAVTSSVSGLPGLSTVILIFLSSLPPPPPVETSDHRCLERPPALQMSGRPNAVCVIPPPPQLCGCPANESGKHHCRVAVHKTKTLPEFVEHRQLRCICC